MGQYYMIVDVDKKEYISPWTYDCGAKLLEWGYIVSDGSANSFVSAFNYLLEHRWKGDRVYVVGDYADIDYKNNGSEFDVHSMVLGKLFGDGGVGGSISVMGETCDNYEDAKKVIESKRPVDDSIADYQLVLACLYEEFADYELSLYALASEKFTEIDLTEIASDIFKSVPCEWDKSRTVVDGKYKAPRYLCNSELEKCYDLHSLPVEWELENRGSVSIYPLAILLSMGNGQGGGDYHESYPDFDLSGTWCRYTRGIFFSDEVPEGYDVLTSNFTERQAVT